MPDVNQNDRTAGTVRSPAPSRPSGLLDLRVVRLICVFDLRRTGPGTDRNASRGSPHTEATTTTPPRNRPPRIPGTDGWIGSVDQVTTVR
ncbi:MAG: hypothetical protein EBQ56_15445 [Proteobacteria bacterium]|nr:hypothetical protein [Pseudomonadota bacterium]